MSFVLRHVTLAGFGQFSAPVSLELHDGVNVLVAPNEAGKSTVMAGVAAILFGLPTSSNPNDFGQARYRHWHSPVRFEGTLEFVAGGETYRIRRRFSTHAVTVSKKSVDGWSDELVGEHNPRAHRRNVQYETFLQNIIGVASRELFASTFAFTQPLPKARQLDGRVQEMLSGAGTGNFGDALKNLVELGRKLTKFTRDPGLTARDAHNDGELETVINRIAQLEAAIEGSRDAVDARQSVQQNLADLQAEAQATRRRIEQTEASIKLWTRWRDLHDNHRAKLQEQGQLQRAWETFHRLEADLQSSRRRLQDDFPEMAAAPDDTGEALSGLRRVRDDIIAQRRQLATELDAHYARAKELLAEGRQFLAERDQLCTLQDRLRSDYGIFENADESTRQQYATYRVSKTALEGRLNEATQQLARRREAAAAVAAGRARFDEAYGDLDGLGDDAIAAVDGRLAALAKREALTAAYARRQSEHASLRRRRLGLFAVSGAALIVTAAASFSAGASLPVVGLLASLALVTVAAAGVYWMRSAVDPEMEQLSAQLRVVEEELQSDERLGPFTDAAAHELGALRERLSARNQAAATLAEQETALPTEDDDDVARAVDRADAALQQFMDATEAGRQQFGDEVEAAYRRWAELRQDVQQRRHWLHSFSRRHFGRETTHPETLAVDDLPDTGVAATWRSVAQLVADAGLLATGAAQDGPATVGAVLDALARWTPEHVDTALAVRARRHTAIARWEARAAHLTERLAPVLSPSEGDVDAAMRRWDEYERRRASIHGLRQEQTGVLAGQGVESADELHERSLQAANLATATYRDLQQLVEEHPTLPHPDEPLDGAAVRAKLHELSSQADELKRHLADVEHRSLALREQLADLTGRDVLNVAQAEQELEQLRHRREQLASEVDAIALAFRELRGAVDAYRQTHRERLAERTTEYWERFTGRRRQVVLDEQFHLSVQDPSGPMHSVTQLSQGAQDQLYLALRLAVADLVADDVALPLLLDDPFVHCDEHRLERIRGALAAVGTTRQVVLFAHRDVFSGWGTPVALRRGGELQ